MKIFGGKVEPIETIVERFIGNEKLIPLGVRKDNLKGGLIILHPKRESTYIEGSKFWLYIYKTSRDIDIDYTDIDNVITKRHGGETFEIFKNVDEAFCVSTNGGIGVGYHGGHIDIMVFYHTGA
jgi:hypothetical protein